MQALQVDRVNLSQKRREMLARCYEIILSDDWEQSLDSTSQKAPDSASKDIGNEQGQS